ncbi:alpha-protein kinase 1 [Fundulus heteroclitus]|uniref:alpha-protein kinase 1 n=1 Tax=Fundulus heteroclitus TaxID=8078 RepID=UPI00165B599E|nr:alpha-protein kinase 1 [Fundulus heteroclitus]XP_036002111.1 alpha-protein kinase 1 [Fundulus heteroclitus]
MEAGGLLEDCLRAAETPLCAQVSEAVRLDYCRCKESLCEELASLLREAVEMKWPFVPEKWQYKLSISPKDKTNLSDLISKHVHSLLDLLRTSIRAQEPHTSLAVVFLVDRFLYWTDESSRLLKITKLLHKRHPDTPVAPQLVIRQARVFLNSGKLQKAESILSSLIYRNGTTGCWVYRSDSDKTLVQAVSVQVRGMVLQKLGLWLQAAELIWASLVGYYSLPQPDKKGIGTSLGLLANILVSMNDEDFRAFKSNPDIDFPSLLGDSGSHRLLSAAQAAKMAVVYSQYTSLYVLTNVTAQGTCLLSYSFSPACPASERASFLQEAREAFAIGLLTKAEGEVVTSQQELHTFLKAAYSITVTDKWLDAPKEAVMKAGQACQQALGLFYKYCHAGTPDKDGLCVEIMHEVTRVKHLLGVEPFPNSEKGSFIPDSYRNVTDASVNFTQEGFSKTLVRFQKYHASLCEGAKSCKGTDGKAAAQLCLTALDTTVGPVTTESFPEASKQKPRSSRSSSVFPSKNADLSPTLESTDPLGSSWQKLSMTGSGSPRPSSGGRRQGASVSDQSSIPTESDDDGGCSQSADESEKPKPQVRNSGISSSPVPKSTTPNSLSHSPRFEVIQAGVETVDYDTDHMTNVDDVETEGSLHSLSQLALKTSSSSLGESFGSRSSWEKISTGQSSPAWERSQPSSLSKSRSKSAGSDGSFFIMDTLDSESSCSPGGVTDQGNAEGPSPLESHDPAQSNPLKPGSHRAPMAQRKPSQGVSDSSAPTEGSEESSFEMLGVSQNGHRGKEATAAEKDPQTSALCYRCLHQSAAAPAPDGQFMLSQQDYQALLAGICHECLLRRLRSKTTLFKLQNVQTAYNALHLKFSKATGLWTARETCVYIGDLMEMEGKQRRAIWVQFLHQEERLSSYVGKDYLKPREIQFHLNDVERQMTAQYYVTEFNKSLYDKEVLAQIFFIPSDALLILNGDEIVGCITVEPYMLGDFVKLTNNTGKKKMDVEATKYGLAFGHFTYLFSGGQEVVVDLQGWTTSNGKGLTYLTDPQIHSTRTPRGPSNFAERGLEYFLKDQHGPTCNEVCNLLKLPPLTEQPHV